MSCLEPIKPTELAQNFPGPHIHLPLDATYKFESKVGANMTVSPTEQDLETYWHSEAQESSYPTYLRLEGTSVNLTSEDQNAEK